MATEATPNRMPHPRSNIGPAERWLSIIGGLGLAAAAAARRGPPAARVAVGVAGASFLARGLTQFCPMKSAITEGTPLGAGFAEQARRAGRLFNRGAAEISTLRDMRLAELQELYSAELQLRALLPELATAAHNVRLRQRIADYATEIAPRLAVLESHIRQLGADAREHPDQGMEALAAEARKMTKVAEADVRDAGLIASVQRLLHYQMAGFGTVAAYARALGETYHAGALAGFSSRDKEVDAQLTDLAEKIINPSAVSREATQEAAVAPTLQ